MSQRTSTTARLFRLPSEVRYQIFEYALSGAVVCYPSKVNRRNSLILNEQPQVPGLLLASRQTYEETIGLYYATSTFRFNDICRLLDWARTVSYKRTEKPLSICLLMDVQLDEETLRTSITDSASNESNNAARGQITGGYSNSAMQPLFEFKEQVSEEDIREARESRLKLAKEALQDDINLAAEQAPRFRGAIIGKLYTMDGKEEMPQLHVAVTPQPVFIKISKRTASDAQCEKMLHRWGPFYDPFLDTTPVPGGFSGRTKALAKLVGVALPGEEAKADDAKSRSTSDVSAGNDPFVDTPPGKNRNLKRSDLAIEMCESAESEVACKQPAFKDLSPIKRVYPHSLMWSGAVVPKFEPAPFGRIWA